MSKKVSTTIPILFLLLLSLVACGTEDRTKQLLNIDNISQGTLIWDDSDPESATWRLQCTSLADFKLLEGLSLREIKSDTELRLFCDQAAKTISFSLPFTFEKADSEIDAFLAALPEYKICSSRFRYIGGLSAEIDAESDYNYAITRNDIGGVFDANEALVSQMAAKRYKEMHEDSALKVFETPAGDICADIQP